MIRNGSSSWLHNLGRLICSLHRLEKKSKDILFLMAVTALIQLKQAELFSRPEGRLGSDEVVFRRRDLIAPTPGLVKLGRQQRASFVITSDIAH
jgi:hypothetical protein